MNKIEDVFNRLIDDQHCDATIRSGSMFGIGARYRIFPMKDNTGIFIGHSSRMRGCDGKIDCLGIWIVDSTSNVGAQGPNLPKPFLEVIEYLDGKKKGDCFMYYQRGANSRLDDRTIRALSAVFMALAERAG